MTLRTYADMIVICSGFPLFYCVLFGFGYWINKSPFMANMLAMFCGFFFGMLTAAGAAMLMP